jgi:hypothetical protein
MHLGLLEVTHRNTTLLSAVHVPDAADHFHQGKVNYKIRNLIFELDYVNT